MGDIFESLSGMDPEAVLAEIAIFVKIFVLLHF